jgi:hypothetical protein
MFRRFMMAAIVAGIATLAGPSTSRADFTITFQQTGFLDAIVTTSSNNISLVDYAFGTYEIDVNAFSNSPGGAIPGSTVGGLLTQNTFSVTTTATGASALTIIISDDRFTTPGPGVAVVTNSISSTFMTTGTASATTEVSPTTGGSFTTGPASVSGPLVGFDGDETGGITTITGSPYTITNSLVLSGLTTAGNRANITTTSSVVVPAPAGLILAATALPFAGLLRRRLRRPEATTAA